MDIIKINTYVEIEERTRHLEQHQVDMSGVLYDIPDESRDYWGRYSVSEDTPVLWGDLWDPNWEDHVSDNWMEHFCLDWCGNCDCHMDEDDINRGGILCQFCEDEENGVEHQ